MLTIDKGSTVIKKKVLTDSGNIRRENTSKFRHFNVLTYQEQV